MRLLHQLRVRITNPRPRRSLGAKRSSQHAPYQYPKLRPWSLHLRRALPLRLRRPRPLPLHLRRARPLPLRLRKPKLAKSLLLMLHRRGPKPLSLHLRRPKPLPLQLCLRKATRLSTVSVSSTWCSRLPLATRSPAAHTLAVRMTLPRSAQPQSSAMATSACSKRLGQRTSLRQMFTLRLAADLFRGNAQASVFRWLRTRPVHRCIRGVLYCSVYRRCAAGVSRLAHVRTRRNRERLLSFSSGFNSL